MPTAANIDGGIAAQPGGPVWIPYTSISGTGSVSSEIRLWFQGGRKAWDYPLGTRTPGPIGFSTAKEGWLLLDNQLELTGDGGRDWHLDPIRIAGITGAAF